MIRKNILAIALLGIFGLSHAADVENLRTLSYLNEPLRLQADIVGEGDIILAAPTEYLRLNHPIPSYDLSVNIVEQNGQKQVVLTTTEEIESPALTLLLESRDKDNRRQLFELPIILDFKPEPAAEPVVAEAMDSEIVIDGVAVNPPVATTAIDKVALAEVPTVAKEETKAKPKAVEKPVAVAVKAEPEKVKAKTEVAKVEKEEAKAPAKAPTKALPKASNTNPDLLKRYPVEKGETLWSIANKVRPANVTPQKMIEIIKVNNPSAFTAGGVLRADVTLLIPTETPKIKHNFVASANANEKSDVRIGYIYELPEPPMQQVAEPAQAAEPKVDIVEEGHDVPVKVVRPVDNVITTVVMDTDLLQDLTPEKAQMAEELLAESQKREQPDTSVVTTVAEVAKSVETAEPSTEPVKAVESAKEEAAKPVEPPKKRPVYIMPEPEPEPGIVELIFENIVYIGAGAFVLILGLLAVVMRRRKGDEPKPPKEKKAKVTADVVEYSEEVEQTEKPKKKGLSLFGKKKEASAPQVKKEKKEKVSKGLFGLGKKKAEAASVEDDVVEVQAVATFTEDPVTPPIDVKPVVKPQVAPVATAAVVTAVAAPKTEEKDEIAIDSLDFDLSSLDLGTTTAEVEDLKDEDMINGLDFDLSEFSMPVAGAELPEESFDINTALDFDLDDFKIEEAPIVEVQSTVMDKDSFGENNPLFAVQSGTKNAMSMTVDEAAHEGSDELEEHISLPKLLENAEDTLLEDDIEAEKPVDFGAFIEDEEAGLANLMEASKNDVAESKIDLSFVADTSENDAGLAFLDTLDLSEKIVLDDPINSSVRDNAAKSVDDIDAFEPIKIDLDLPTLDITENEESKGAEIETPEVTLVEPVIEESAVEEIETQEVTSVEPVIKESAVEEIETQEVTSVEPVIKESAVEEIETPEVTLVEPVIEESAVEEIETPEVTLVEPVIEESAVEEMEMPVAQTTTAENSDTPHDIDFESEQVKLELAVAYMDFDKSLAKPLLDEVVKDGSPSQIARAQALLAQIN